MPIQPSARRVLLELTAHIRKKAQALLGDDAPETAETSDEAVAAEEAPLVGGTPLAHVEAAFALSSLEYAAVVCLLAAEVEPIFRTVVRALQREGGRPWLELGTVAEILALDRAQLPSLFELFLPTGKLRAAGLALVDEGTIASAEEAPMIHVRVKAPRRLLRYCLGVDELPDGMTLCLEPRDNLAESLLAETERDDLLSRVRYAMLSKERLLVDLHGTDGVGKKYLAEGVAHELGRAILFVDVRRWERRGLAALTSANIDLHVAEVTREATLANALVYFDHWNSLVDDAGATPQVGSNDPDDAKPTTTSRRPMPPAFASFLERHPDVVFLGSPERYTQIDHVHTAVVRVPIGFPGPAQRGRLWQRTIAASGAALEEGIDTDELGRKFALDPARIVAATRTAVELATLHHPGAQVTLGREDIVAASRRQLQHELASLAVRMDKAHKWDDLVIPAEVFYSLQELLAYAKYAGDVWEKQGFAARHSIPPGISALFSGPPGTGKTMCASIVARELDMELFRVDLSRVVSKWIGETEKNLAKVFDEAQRSQAVILFDEADSLFAKRTEVKSSIDRYANLEVSYLLQRMEQFSGVTVLTSNFEDTIDPAFKRRITFKMRFERPNGKARAALWKKMFPSQARVAANINYDEIGEKFELAGGNIRNAAVRSAFLAAADGSEITEAHVRLAAAREAREMGSLVTEPARKLTKAEEAAAIVEDNEPEPEPEPTPAPSRPAKAFPISHPRR